MGRRLIKIVFIFFLCFLVCQSTEEEKSDFFSNKLVNLNHINSLCEDVNIDGDSAMIVHIYADYPDYKWAYAEDEGIACVDDAARAVVMYLRYYEIIREKWVLKRVKKLLRFVFKMQEKDGEFYNFIGNDLRINRTALTSLKSFDFWAVRGYWALGYAYRIFYYLDKKYAAILKKKFLLCKAPIRKLLQNYGRFRPEGGKDYPVWLVNGSGSDATSELLLGLCNYLESEKDHELESYALKLAEGIIAMQLEDKDVFPGAFLSYLGLWHAWGNAQSTALIFLSKLLNAQKFISAAEIEVRRFYSRLIREDFLHSFSLNNEVKEKRFPQIAYDLKPVIVGLIELHRERGNKEYGELAGLAAAWFFGRNPAGQQMYDVYTGRCYDGIDDSTKVNLNSGAESTIEAIESLLEVSSDSIAYQSMMKWLENKENIEVRDIYN